MILKLAILCLMSALAFGIWDKGFQVKYRFRNHEIGANYYIALPENYTQAISKSWENVTKAELPDEYDELSLMCPKDDYTVCVYYDDTGYVAGLQIAIDPNYCYEVVYDWTEAGFTQWNVTSNGTTITYWATQQLYVSSDYLATNASTRVANRDANYTMQEDYYYVSGFNNTLLAIPRNHSEIISSSSSYTKQSCVDGFGQQYYYNMTANLTCSASAISTYIPMDSNNQSSGLGFMLPANCTVPTGKIKYFEYPTTSQIETIVPNAPECFYDYADSPGFMTLQTYFIQTPYFITC